MSIRLMPHIQYIWAYRIIFYWYYLYIVITTEFDDDDGDIFLYLSTLNSHIPTCHFLFLCIFFSLFFFFLNIFWQFLHGKKNYSCVMIAVQSLIIDLKMHGHTYVLMAQIHKFIYVYICIFSQMFTREPPLKRYYSCGREKMNLYFQPDSGWWRISS